MHASFESALAVLLEHEGGFANHPADPGGATNFGVADAGDGKKDGLIDLDRDGVGDVRPRDLTREQAADYYRRHYWLSYYERIVMQKVATKVFVLAVHCNHKQAHLLLQRALRAAGRPVVEDGEFGPATLAAVNTCDPQALVAALRSETAGFYRLLAAKDPKKEVFLEGWLRRAYA